MKGAAPRSRRSADCLKLRTCHVTGLLDVLLDAGPPAPEFVSLQASDSARLSHALYDRQLRSDVVDELRQLGAELRIGRKQLLEAGLDDRRVQSGVVGEALKVAGGGRVLRSSSP